MGGRGSAAGRPRRGTGASMSQTCDQPRRRDRNARRRPSGDQRAARAPPGLPATRVDRDPVGLDDPELVVAQVGDPATVGRPLRVGDRLLGSGQLGRVAAAQRQREELPRPGGLGRVGHDPVAWVEAELARRLDRDDRLDREAARGRARLRRHQAAWLRPSGGRDPTPEHRRVLADVTVQAVVGPAPAVGRAKLLDRQACRSRRRRRVARPRVPLDRGLDRLAARRLDHPLVPRVDPLVGIGQPVAAAVVDVDRSRRLPAAQSARWPRWSWTVHPGVTWSPREALRRDGGEDRLRSASIAASCARNSA